jgi:hypothetical protein
MVRTGNLARPRAPDNLPSGSQSGIVPSQWWRRNGSEGWLRMRDERENFRGSFSLNKGGAVTQNE